MSGSSNTQFKVTLGDDETSRLEDFAAATNGWFWETDSGHHFTYMSASVQDVTGVPREWHYGKTREELGSPDGVTPVEWAEHLRTIRERRPFSNFAYQRIGPNRKQWLRTSGRPVYSDDGVFQGYRGIATDISAEMAAKERVKALVRIIRDRYSKEQELTEIVQRLENSNERQQELSMVLAHDLRGPLASVRTALAAVLDGGSGGLDHRARDYMRKSIELLCMVAGEVFDEVGAQFTNRN